jgi:nitrogen-specific signal transduction histidine kinase
VKGKNRRKIIRPPASNGPQPGNDVLHSRDIGLLKEALRKRVSHLTVLYQMGRDISENENWSDALDRFLMALVRYMQAEGAALLLFSGNRSVLTPRASFQVDEDTLNASCDTLLTSWESHPRALEIHSLEGYEDGDNSTCLERTKPWRISVIPLRHRNRALGFLILEKLYESPAEFEIDYQFLNTIQTIFSEQVANAAYISELRRLGRFNKKVLDNINSGVITTDTQGFVDFFNHRARVLCSLLGEKRRIHFNDMFQSDSFDRDFFKKLIGSKKVNHVLEVEAARDESGFFPARLSTSKMVDENLNGEVIVAIFEDLTEQKALEKEIRRNDRLRTLGQISAGVAHEIRNPLTGIATSVEVLEGKLKGDDDKKKFIHAVRDEINRLDKIIKNLLDYARPMKPRMKTCFLGDVATRVVNLLSENARRKGITLNLVDNSGDICCRADADQITQVVLNIVLNAVQACKQGDEINVILSGTLEGRKKFARIEVIDSGPGVPEEIRGSMFDPFVTTRTRGTGMGLAISQQIIEEHEGKIKCDFLPRGTKFTILLPTSPAGSKREKEQRSVKHVESDIGHR